MTEPDQAVLDQLHSLGGPTLLCNLLELFEKLASERIQVIHEAVSSLDRTRISREAHALKSNGGSLGFRSLYEACNRLEAEAEAVPETELREAVDQINQLVEAALLRAQELRRSYRS